MDFTERVNQLRAKVGDKTPEQIEKFDQEMEKFTNPESAKVVPIRKKKKEDKESNEKSVFGFIPTQLTRINPFHPMSRKAMKDRPLERIVHENSWGRITFIGERLSIYDETVLLSVLLLMRRRNSNEFYTTRHELCRIMGVIKGRDPYNAIWKSLQRLTHTGVDLDVWEGKDRKTKNLMADNILWRAKMDEDTGRIFIIVNPYFVETYVDSLYTNLDLNFRVKLKGDITKALYRFYEGQRGIRYQCHMNTLCEAINLDTGMKAFRLRDRLKKGLQELQNQKNLKSWKVTKNGMISACKSAKLRLKQ